MSKLTRGALLATLLYAFPQCGGTPTDVTEDPGPTSAGRGAGGEHAGDAGSKAGGSSGTGNVAQAGSASGGDSGISHAGGAAGGSSETGGGAGAAGAAGALSGVGCGGATCGPNEYCRAPCSGTGFGIGGTTGLPMPSCSPLPATCNGTPTCDCICGVGSGFRCSTGSKPIMPGPAVQCGCA